MTSVSESTIGIKWDIPEDDGGCDITDYIVERRDASKRQWKPVTTLDALEHLVANLTEGTSYFFRVAAENEVGVGEFAELPQAVTAKSPHGKILSFI